MKISFLLFIASATLFAQNPPPVEIELMTYPEIYSAIHEQGKTTVIIYNGGTEQPFSFNGLPDGSLKSASAMFLDDESTLPAIYITDPLDQSVYQVTLAGTFRYRFRSADPTAFRQLSGVFVDQDRVFVASGSLVYTFALNDTAGTPTPGP